MIKLNAPNKNFLLQIFQFKKKKEIRCSCWITLLTRKKKGLIKEKRKDEENKYAMKCITTTTGILHIHIYIILFDSKI